MVHISKHIISFLLINFIIFSKCSIITNPVGIPSDSDVDDYIIVMKSEKVRTQQNHQELTIIKDLNEIRYKEKVIFLCPAFFLCKDENDKYFLFM